MPKILRVIASELGLASASSGWPLVRLLLGLLPRGAFERLRVRILRGWGVKIGHGTVIAGTPDLAGPVDPRRRLTIGAGCVINTPVHFDLNGKVTIGDRVSIGHHVVFVTTDHDLGTSLMRADRPTPKDIVVEDGAWIGARVTILPGVRVGSGAIVAAGAVVSTDVPPNMVAVGNPARAAKALPSDEEVTSALQARDNE